MSLMSVVFRALNKQGDAFVEPRREDGHGSTTANRSHVSAQLTDGANPVGTAGNPLSVAVLGQIVPKTFNQIDLTYTADGAVSTAVYKLSGATVATLTLSYTSGKLVSVVRT